MKILSVFVVCLTVVVVEPSVPAAQYLLTSSPQYGTPSTQYGAPNDYTIALIPAEQYGTPNLQYNIQTQYGVPAISSNAISESYFTPESKPNIQYGVPQISKIHSANNDQNSKSQNIVSTSNDVHLTSTKPKSQYDIHNAYLASTEGSYLDKYEANDEPASYSFKYYIQNSDGNDFGHEEDRQGDVANGRYHVLLPDGKRQTVEYTADADGYKSRISYEQIGNGYGYEQENVKHGGYSH